MSAVRQGAHLLNEAQNLNEKLEDGVYTAPAHTDPTQGGAGGVQFARKFSAREKKDDIMSLRQQLSDGKGHTPFGSMQFDDSDAEWILRKQDAVEAANYDSWFNVNFNKNDLADRQLAQQLDPQFYAAREREIMARAKEAVNIRLMQLRGPQSKEDMYKLYLIDSGKVKLPADWDRIGPVITSTKNVPAAVDQEQFRRGLIRLPRLTNYIQRQQNVTDNVNAGAWGSARSAKNIFSFGRNIPDENNRPLAHKKPNFGKNTLKILKKNNWFVDSNE